MTQTTTIYRLFRQYMADHNLFIVPADWLTSKPLSGLIFVCEEQQFTTLIAPTFCVDSTLKFTDMLSRLKENFLILEYYSFSNLGDVVLNVCDVVDDCYFYFDDTYFIPFVFADADADVEDTDGYKIQPKGN